MRTGTFSNTRGNLLFNTIEHHPIQVALSSLDIKVKDDAKADHEELENPEE